MHDARRVNCEATSREGVDKDSKRFGGYKRRSHLISTGWNDEVSEDGNDEDEDDDDTTIGCACRSLKMISSWYVSGSMTTDDDVS